MPYMVLLTLEAAEALFRQGIEAEVIDPRTLKSLDLHSIVRSVQKTERLVVVNERHLTGGFGLAGLELMPVKVFRALQQALEGLEWTGAEALVTGLRTVKSPAEQAVIHDAYRLAQAGLEAGHRQKCARQRTSSSPTPRWRT